MIAWDLETHPIVPGMIVPKMVCLSWASRDGNNVNTGLLDRDNGLKFFRRMITGDEILVGANVYFDLGVPCAEDPTLVRPVFEAFEAERIRDVLVAQKMRDIRDGYLDGSAWLAPVAAAGGKWMKGKHALAEVLWRTTGRDRRGEKKRGKEDEEEIIRLRFAELEGIPVADWPEEFKVYAIEDSTDALEIHEIQGEPIADELRQIRYQWAFQLMGVWGIRTDPDAVKTITEVLEAEAEAGRAELRKSGIIRTDGTKDMKVIYDRVQSAYARAGKVVPMTDGGKKNQPKPKTDADTLDESGDPDLLLLSEVSKTFKLLSKDIPQMTAGVSVPICPHWNNPLETGRSSVSPNVQNLPRKGGIRECYVPRKGWVYISADLDTIELRALAQVCLEVVGFSSLAETLKAGRDPHAALGARLLGLSYEDMIDQLAAGVAQAEEYRQFAKIPNFGLPGGMGAKGLVGYAKSNGVNISEEFAQVLVRAWHDENPEMRDFFTWVKSLVGYGGEGKVIQIRSGRERGRVGFCDGANGFFQGLTADAAKSALYVISRECYLGTSDGSPLLGSRPVLFIHDEVIAETPYGDEPQDWIRASYAADRLAKVLTSTVQGWIPDIPITSKPVMTRRWYKGAKPVRVDGVLVPSRPEKDQNGKTLWVQDL